MISVIITISRIIRIITILLLLLLICIIIIAREELGSNRIRVLPVELGNLVNLEDQG